jgi:hypothetical protein
VSNSRFDTQKHNLDYAQECWNQDFAKLEAAFRNLGISIHASKRPAEEADRKETISLIQEFFSSSSQDEEKQTWILYWSGHGQRDTGDWIFSKHRLISLDDILRLWTKSGAFAKQRQLIIIADCCNSGSWTRRLTQIQKEISNSPKHRWSKLKVAVQAACRANEGAYFDRRGSFLTQKFLCDMSMRNKTEDSAFTWACWIQHPQTASITPGGKPVREYYSKTGERFSIVSSIRLTTVEHEWWIEDDFKSATFFGDGEEIKRSPLDLKTMVM